jgi:antitoxin MazE
MKSTALPPKIPFAESMLLQYNYIHDKTEMRTYIIRIGNSKGLRIPKTVLQQCGIERDVELWTEGDMILIKPIRKKTRENWSAAFKRMADRKEDELLIDDKIGLDMDDWEW